VPAAPVHLAPVDRLEDVEQPGPFAIAALRQLLRRVDDVDEQHRAQLARGSGGTGHARKYDNPRAGAAR
jgi:hypothetical protein